jgi:formylglycine-generating enzyme required for sulfatase activity
VWGLVSLAALGASALEGERGLARPARAWAEGIMLVQAGAFWMGSDVDGPDEGPRHRVFVTDFWIERTKVTNREFAAFLDAAGTRSAEGVDYFDAGDDDARIHRAAGRFAADTGFADHPVVEVSWFGARDYCRWQGRRLPTEAEWEKAARGEDSRPYPWGDGPPTPARAVYGRPRNATAPTDGRPDGKSPYGVLDLVGNAREWTASELRPYPYQDPARFGDEGGHPAARVVRGASHDDSVLSLRLTIRRSYEGRGAARGHHNVGFRCATSEDLGGY